MNEKEFKFEFMKKNYNFLISSIDKTKQTIIINYKENSSKSCIIEINKLSQYLSILNNSINNNHNIIEEKIQEYIEFIYIIGNQIQIKQAMDQLMNLLLTNLDYVKKNSEILSFFEEYIDKNDYIKYYYFIIFFLKEITMIKEVNVSYLNQEIDWYLDNIGSNYTDFNEESYITDFIIR